MRNKSYFSGLYLVALTSAKIDTITISGVLTQTRKSGTKLEPLVRNHLHEEDTQPYALDHR